MLKKFKLGRKRSGDQPAPVASYPAPTHHSPRPVAASSATPLSSSTVSSASAGGGVGVDGAGGSGASAPRPETAATRRVAELRRQTAAEQDLMHELSSAKRTCEEWARKVEHLDGQIAQARREFVAAQTAVDPVVKQRAFRRVSKLGEERREAEGFRAKFEEVEETIRKRIEHRRVKEDFEAANRALASTEITEEEVEVAMENMREQVEGVHRVRDALQMTIGQEDFIVEEADAEYQRELELAMQMQAADLDAEKQEKIMHAGRVSSGDGVHPRKTGDSAPTEVTATDDGEDAVFSKLQKEVAPA